MSLATRFSGSPRIVIGSFEVPGYGGAATVGYKLFETLRESGVDAWLLNIIAQPDAAYFQFHFGTATGNPKGLRCVRNHFLAGPTFDDDPGLASLLHALQPDVLLGMGWVGALLLKRAAPHKKLLLYTTGCSQVKKLLERGKVRDAISLQRNAGLSRVPPGHPCAREREAVALSDLILTHSEMMLDLFRYFFPRSRGKVHPQVIGMHEWIVAEARSYAGLARPFGERDVDVLFVANSWARKEKNYPMVKRIIASCQGLRLHVVGEVESQFDGAEYSGFISDRTRLFRLLGNTKSVACPSLFDAAPGVLFEAAAMGANVVASRNCGNWSLCHEQLLVDPPSASRFVSRIQESIHREFPTNMEGFGRNDAVGRLTGLLRSLLGNA